VVRFSIDYDLMTVLARDMWHLRDEMDVSSKADHTFAAADISPRRETAEALTDFYGAWRKSFDQAWKVMTDLGNLLDEVGKAFYDQDASTSVGAAEQVAAFQRQTASSALQDQTGASAEAAGGVPEETAGAGQGAGSAAEEAGRPQQGIRRAVAAAGAPAEESG
jgi:hypothetical protein